MRDDDDLDRLRRLATKRFVAAAFGVLTVAYAAIVLLLGR